MGLRGTLAIAAAVVALGGCSSAAAESVAKPPAASQAPAGEWTGTHALTQADAERAVAATPRSDSPAPTPYGSWDCSTPMTFHPAVAPGVDVATVYRELEYPVAYLNALGYQAAIGSQAPYERNAKQPTERGNITVVVAKNRSDQADLEADHKLRAEALFDQDENNASAALIVHEERGLAGDILLHEVGHVLGLDHHVGTVMNGVGPGSLVFDADETAAITCN